MERLRLSDRLNTKAVIIKGPGAVGKTEIIRRLMQDEYYRFQKVARYTTRIPGDNEVDGVDYHFIPESHFLDKVKDGQFIEYKKYLPGYYGTSSVDIERVVSNNRIALLDIDPDAATLIEEYLTSNGIGHKSFYIIPISLNIFRSQGGVDIAGDEVERRMLRRNRASDHGTWGAVGRRREAIEWFRRVKQDDMLISNINGNLDHTIRSLLEQIN